MTESQRRDTRPKGVTRDAIAAAAAVICEEHGLEALSMRRVAVALGVTPMALYHHVRGKDDLIEVLTEHVREQVVVDHDLPPRAQLLALLEQLRQLGARYPRLVEAGALTDQSEGAVRLTLTVIRLLAELGLNAAQVRITFNALTLLVNGAAAVQRTVERAGGVAAQRLHEDALLRSAEPSDRDLIAAMRKLPRVTVPDQFARAVDLVLDAAATS